MTSQQVGLMLLPSALAAGFMMPFAGKVLSGKADPRVALAFGTVLLGATLFALSPMTSQMGVDDFYWPLLIRGAGMAFMFMPLNLAALGPIPRRDIAAASGFFNLTRQLGGSLGIAILSTFLTQRIAFHAATLTEHLSVTDPATTERLGLITQSFVRHGMALGDAQRAAAKALGGVVMREASVMAFGDIFWVVAMMVFGSLALIALLGRPPKGAAGMGGAH